MLANVQIPKLLQGKQMGLTGGCAASQVECLLCWLPTPIGDKIFVQGTKEVRPQTSRLKFCFLWRLIVQIQQRLKAFYATHSIYYVEAQKRASKGSKPKKEKKTLTKRWRECKTLLIFYVCLEKGIVSACACVSVCAWGCVRLWVRGERAGKCDWEVRKREMRVTWVVCTRMNLN